MTRTASDTSRATARATAWENRRRPHIDKVLQALRAGNTRHHAASFAGIKRQTFYRWLDASEDFAKAVEEAESNAVVAAVATIRQAFGSDWRAAAWWLERRIGEDYRERKGMEVTGADGAALEVILTRGFTNAEKRTLRHILAEASAEHAAEDAGSDPSGAREPVDTGALSGTS